jgi:hypothetical protein
MCLPRHLKHFFAKAFLATSHILLTPAIASATDGDYEVTHSALLSVVTCIANLLYPCTDRGPSQFFVTIYFLKVLPKPPAVSSKYKQPPSHLVLHRSKDLRENLN